jgi:uncharacterized protein YhaN
VIVRELRLERFGHFADAVLPLAPGLTLLYGPNEAGKSTLLAALRAFLFGFPRGAAFDFRWPSESLAVAGTLAFADGQVAELRREKKRGLRGKLGEVTLTDELLRARLGRPSESLFSTVFAFALDDLARGGEALRDEGLRAGLAGAGLGATKSPQAVIEQLRQQAEALFTVKGRAGKQINAALGELKEQRRALAEAQVRGEDYQARVREREAASAEAARLGRERAQLLGRIGEKEALLRALPRRDELRGAVAERRTLSPPAGLSPTAGDDYQRALEERARLADEAQALDAKLVRARREAEGLVVDEKLCKAAARVRPLQEHVGRHALEAAEAEELATSLRARRSELSRRLGELRPGWTPEELDVLPHPLFTNGLERLREGWSGQRERARELTELAARRAQLDGERGRQRRRLDPPWPLGAAPGGAPSDPGELPFLPVPRAEEVKQQRAEHKRLDDKLAQIERDDERLKREQRELESKRARLDAGGAVPSTEELTRLRAARDAAWADVRRALASPVAPSQSAAARDASPPVAPAPAALADAFEAAGRAADAHADELRRRSSDVAARAELTLRLGEVERARADRAHERGQTTAERARAEAAWQALWTRCGFSPQSPETMLEWLEDHARLQAIDAERAQLEARAATLQLAQDEYARRLSGVMRTLRLDEVTELAAQKRVVELVLELREEIDGLRRDEERARKLGGSVAAFRDDVRRLCNDVAPPLATLEATAAMRALDERLRAAATARQRREDLTRVAAELADERQAGTARLERKETELAGWRARAGVADDGAFVQAAEAARRVHQLDGEVARLERALAETRGAMGAAAFDAALQTAERALLEDEVAELRARLDAAEETYRAANQRQGAATAQLGQLDGGARAAELTMSLESRRAKLRGYVEQYAVVTLARTLLERQVSRFQERHQPRLLGELSALFAALTEGRYPRVYQRLDDEGTFVAVRADGSEVTPAAMSTGTREQLYLAVRLAYVRHYCDATEPLPLVLDDVLVNFDAGRARATLRVLTEFAARSQVLMLTCHEHLAQLAAEVAGVREVRLPTAA